MAIWSPKIHHGARVKYVGIVEAIEADIKNRLLKPGDRLPAQRQIAQTLNVDLTTVTRAINEAARRGLVETQPGSGCFVAQTAFAHYNSMYLTEGKLLDLSMNNPPSPSNIQLEQDIANTLLKLSERTQSSLSHLYYQETAGHPADREAGAQWLKSRIAEASADAVLISSGAHSAIFSILSHLQRCGATAIAAPELCYPGLRSIADYLGLDVYSVKMDESGLLVEDLINVISTYQPDALYLIPNIDNPTTATLTTERRYAIAELAREHNLTLIEDDPYFELLDKPLPSLYSLAPELSWHIATVSKCLSPALRVAYIVAPSVDDALALAEEIRISNIMAPPLMTAIVSEWINNGYFDAVATAIKQENINRQDLATAILGLKPNHHAVASPHIWLTLPKGIRALDFSERASRAGVSVVPSTAFVTTRSRTQAVRISLGVAKDHSSLKYGLSLLAELLDAKASRSNFII